MDCLRYRSGRVITAPHPSPSLGGLYTGLNELAMDNWGVASAVEGRGFTERLNSFA